MFPVPTIHMNGSPEEFLRDDLVDAMESARNLRHALGKIAPNGRDYYPQGGKALSEAQDRHGLRIKALNEIEADLNYLIENIAWTK